MPCEDNSIVLIVSLASSFVFDKRTSNTYSRAFYGIVQTHTESVVRLAHRTYSSIANGYTFNEAVAFSPRSRDYCNYAGRTRRMVNIQRRSLVSTTMHASASLSPEMISRSRVADGELLHESVCSSSVWPSKSGDDPSSSSLASSRFRSALNLTLGERESS